MRRALAIASGAVVLIVILACSASSYVSPGAVVSSYDEFQGTNVHKIEDMTVSGSGNRVLDVRAVATGPSAVLLTLSNSSDGWRYLRCHDLSFLADNKRVDTPDAEHDGSVLDGGHVLEHISVPLTMDQFDEMGRAERTRGRLCSTTFEFDEEQRATIREFVTRARGQAPAEPREWRTLGEQEVVTDEFRGLEYAKLDDMRVLPPPDELYFRAIVNPVGDESMAVGVFHSSERHRYRECPHLDFMADGQRVEHGLEVHRTRLEPSRIFEIVSVPISADEFYRMATSSEIRARVCRTDFEFSDAQRKALVDFAELNWPARWAQNVDEPELPRPPGNE